MAHAHAIATSDAQARELLHSISSGQWRHQIEPIRTAYARALKAGQDPKAAAQPLKARLSAVLWSGQFKTRAKAVPLGEKLAFHSGLLCADIDDVAERLPEIRTALQSSPHTLAVFLSPTGTGLKVLLKVKADAESHLASFHAVKAHIRELAGCEIDEACKDPTRLCFFSHDPQCWIRRGDAVEIVPLDRCTIVQGTRVQESTRNPSNSSTVLKVLSVEEAVKLSAPNRPSRNHRLLYRLCGALKAYEQTTGAAITDSVLRDAFKQWYTKAKPFLKAGQSEQEYFLEFGDAWGNIKRPLGENLIDAAWSKSATAPTPPEATANGFDEKKICRLISFCREFQALRGTEPFELSPYIVAKLFGQKSHSTAAVWLGGLCGFKILTKVAPGNPGTRRAATYRYNQRQP